jgi:CRISPR/Cas system endoribonuclease Cas6 (RAMP superfamily)
MAKAPIKSSAPIQTTVRIANQHTAPIMFPRKTGQGVFTPPLILLPGSVTEIEGELWNTYKESKVLQGYLDRGILAEVRSGKQVVATEASTVDLEVPEHLSGDDHQGEMAGAKILTPGVGGSIKL